MECPVHGGHDVGNAPVWASSIPRMSAFHSINSGQSGTTCVPRQGLHHRNWYKTPKLVLWDGSDRLRCDCHIPIQRPKKKTEPAFFTFPIGLLSLLIRNSRYRDLGTPHQHASSSSFIVICHFSCQNRSPFNAKVSFLLAEIARSSLALVYFGTLTVECVKDTYLLIMIPTFLTPPVFKFPASFFSFPL